MWYHFIWQELMHVTNSMHTLLTPLSHVQLDTIAIYHELRTGLFQYVKHPSHTLIIIIFTFLPFLLYLVVENFERKYDEKKIKTKNGRK